MNRGEQNITDARPELEVGDLLDVLDGLEPVGPGAHPQEGGRGGRLRVHRAWGNMKSWFL